MLLLLALAVVAFLYYMLVIKPKSVVITPLGGVTSSDNPVAKTPDSVAPAVMPPAGSPNNSVNVPVNVPAVSPVAPIVPVVSGTTGINPARKVSVIQVSKNSAGKTQPVGVGENQDWKTFQIGEIVVFDEAGNQLPGNAYSSASYNVNEGTSLIYSAMNALDGNKNSFSHTFGQQDVHTLTITLSSPVNVSKVDVYNRQDCVPVCNNRLNGAVVTFLDVNNNIIKVAPLTSELVQHIVM